MMSFWLVTLLFLLKVTELPSPPNSMPPFNATMSASTAEAFRNEVSKSPVSRIRAFWF